MKKTYKNLLKSFSYVTGCVHKLNTFLEAIPSFLVLHARQIQIDTVIKNSNKVEDNKSEVDQMYGFNIIFI